MGAHEQAASAVHVDSRLPKALLAARRLSSLGVPAAVAMNMWRTAVLPQALYGCEVRNISHAQLQSLWSWQNHTATTGSFGVEPLCCSGGGRGPTLGGQCGSRLAPRDAGPTPPMAPDLGASYRPGWYPAPPDSLGFRLYLDGALTGPRPGAEQHELAHRLQSAIRSCPAVAGLCGRAPVCGSGSFPPR